MHRNSQLLFERYAPKYFSPGMRVLEIGPASHPSHYAASLDRPGLTWHTIDIAANPALTFRAEDPYHYPIPDDAYDVVLSGQVLEHVPRIWVWIKELARVCKPGGHVLVINPVSWPYHEAPVDCWRVYPEGMRTLYAEAGLDVILSRSESIEAEGVLRVIHGRGRDWQGGDERALTERLAPLGAPVECSLDTITIGRKPPATTRSPDPLPTIVVTSADGTSEAATAAPASAMSTRVQDDYGIYTAADNNFFPGVVVQLRALRLHGYRGPLAVIDTGLDTWMRDYLARHGATLISLDFLKAQRYTDVLSTEMAGMRGWSFKAFGISHARLFKRFTFIDADYIPLCNLQEEFEERLKAGNFLCTEDGANTWGEAHADAMGVRPGTYMNINAGFFSAALDHHEPILEEWRNLMTRRKPFDLWYGDQGALNAILDKYDVPKVLVGDKADWNQTWLNETLAKDGLVTVDTRSPPVVRHQNGRRIYGWHGCGWWRYWHGIGIDHYRKDRAEIEKIRQECNGKVPKAVLDVFASLLFSAGDLVLKDHLLVPA